MDPSGLFSGPEARTASGRLRGTQGPCHDSVFYNFFFYNDLGCLQSSQRMGKVFGCGLRRPESGKPKASAALPAWGRRTDFADGQQSPGGDLHLHEPATRVVPQVPHVGRGAEHQVPQFARACADHGLLEAAVA